MVDCYKQCYRMSLSPSTWPANTYLILFKRKFIAIHDESMTHEPERIYIPVDSSAVDSILVVEKKQTAHSNPNRYIHA